MLFHFVWMQHNGTTAPWLRKTRQWIFYFNWQVTWVLLNEWHSSFVLFSEKSRKLFSIVYVYKNIKHLFYFPGKVESFSALCKNTCLIFRKKLEAFRHCVWLHGVIEHLIKNTWLSFSERGRKLSVIVYGCMVHRAANQKYLFHFPRKVGSFSALCMLHQAAKILVSFSEKTRKPFGIVYASLSSLKDRPHTIYITHYLTVTYLSLAKDIWIITRHALLISFPIHIFSHCMDLRQQQCFKQPSSMLTF